MGSEFRASLTLNLQELPPVGKYETWHSIGKQPLSGFKTLPAYGFGSSSWDAESKRYLSSGHAKELQGTASPSNYEHQHNLNLSAFGKQVGCSFRPS